MNREHAQEFSESLDRVGEGWYRMAILAGQMGVPDALGLSWGEWTDKYMPRLKLAIKQRQAVVKEMSAGGLSNRKIAAVLGVSDETVNRDQRATNVAPEPEGLAALEPTIATNVAPAHTARADRVERDNRAEQNRAARDEREASVVEVPAPEIRHGELSKALADVGEVDLIFTDPPYPREFLPAWRELGEWAAQALKPGALLVAYSGQYHLPEVLDRLSEHLEYQWLGWLSTTGPQVAVHQRPIMSGGKPLLIFSNGPLAEPYRSRRFFDSINSEGRTRELHTWEQAEGPAAYYIEALTERGELVVDPFLGSGTFAYVANKLGRRFIGCDKDSDAIATTKKRLAA